MARTCGGGLGECARRGLYAIWTEQDRKAFAQGLGLNAMESNRDADNYWRYRGWSAIVTARATRRVTAPHSFHVDDHAPSQHENSVHHAMTKSSCVRARPASRTANVIACP